MHLAARSRSPKHNGREGLLRADGGGDIQQQGHFTSSASSSSPDRSRPHTSSTSLAGSRMSAWRGGWLGASAVVIGATLFLLLSVSTVFGPPEKVTLENDQQQSSVSSIASLTSSSSLSDTTTTTDANNAPAKPAPAPALRKANKHQAELDRLNAARLATDEAAKAIEQRYGQEDAEELFASMHFLNRDVVRGKILRAVLRQSQFVVSFAGTSVTAGHDNFLNQSFPLVFQREANSSFAAAGVDLVVRNHAMGNNPAIPASFCLGSQLGSDTDVAVWEFGMMVGGDSRNGYVELWMRNAIALPKQPALMLLDPGEGARKPDGNGNLPTDVRRGLPGDMSRGFVDIHGTGEDLLHHYRDFGVHTQAMLEAVWTLDTKEPYNFRTLVDKDKPTSRGASWHPGPHGHALRGRILAYHYLRLLSDALADAYFAVQNDEVEAALQAPVVKVPPPLTCHPAFCDKPTHCALSFEPRAESYLLDLVTQPDKVAPGKTDENADNSHWHVQLYEADQGAVRFSKENGFGYLDLKYILQASKAAGPLSFKFESEQAGHVLVCQPPGVWNKLPDGCGQLDKDATIDIDGKVVSFGDQEWEKQHGIESSTCFATLEPLPAGPHTLTVTPLHDDKYVMVSAIVWPASTAKGA